VPGLRKYRVFLHDVRIELDRIERLTASGSSRGCLPGCADCCSPITVLPVEAYAVVTHAESEGWGRIGGTPNSDACAFLSEEHVCAIYQARPFLCRTRGYPILHLNGDGEWERDACKKRGFVPDAGEPVGLSLETWNARLFRLNEEFCAKRGISPGRIRLRDLLPSQNAAMSPTCR